MTLADQTIRGRYATGIGRALPVAEDSADVFRRHVGAPLIGTFNLALEQPFGNDPRPSFANGDSRFFLCRLRSQAGDVRRGWYIRYRSPVTGGDSPRPDRLEVYTKARLPDSFKTGPVDVVIPDRWTDQQARDWSRGQYWFQSYPWSAVQRSDSAKVWEAMKGADDWELARVLDFGCNTGFHAIRAAQAGAIVLGCDKDEGACERSQFINDHIEMQDATFEPRDRLPEVGERFDFVFCLSVLHQFDPTYQRLEGWLERLLATGRVVWLELINPPLAGRLSEADVNRLVSDHGGEARLRYRHKVRRWRTLYRLER